VAYTHRGSWKASRSVRGKIVDTVPVVWAQDWSKAPGSPPSLIVWFENPREASEHLAAGKAFVVAVAKKVEGKASSANINGLFNVAPVEMTTEPHGLRCEVLAPVTDAGA